MDLGAIDGIFHQHFPHLGEAQNTERPSTIQVLELLLLAHPTVPTPALVHGSVPERLGTKGGASKWIWGLMHLSVLMLAGIPIGDQWAGKCDSGCCLPTCSNDSPTGILVNNLRVGLSTGSTDSSSKSSMPRGQRGSSIVRCLVASWEYSTIWSHINIQTGSAMYIAGQKQGPRLGIALAVEPRGRIKGMLMLAKPFSLLCIWYSTNFSIVKLRRTHTYSSCILRGSMLHVKCVPVPSPNIFDRKSHRYLIAQGFHKAPQLSLLHDVGLSPRTTDQWHSDLPKAWHLHRQELIANALDTCIFYITFSSPIAEEYIW